LDTLGKEKPYEKVGLFYCQTKGSNNQLFSLTKTNNLRKEDFCLAPKYTKKLKMHTNFVYLVNCPNHKDFSLEWKYFYKNKTFVHLKSGLCLDGNNSNNNENPILNNCNLQNPNQIWIWKQKFEN
jgi:hypothetical protein